MILFIIKSVENTIISNIKIYGIKFVEKYDSIIVNKISLNAAIVRAPKSVDATIRTINNKQVLSEPYFIFDSNSNNTICKKDTQNTINDCIFHISEEDLHSETLNTRVDEFLTLNVITDGQADSQQRHKRGLLEMLKTGHFFASDFAEERVEDEVHLEEQRDELLSDEIKTMSETTKHVVESTQQRFDLLGLSLCLLRQEETTSKIEAILTQKISQMFFSMTKIIEDCSFGLVTTEVNNNHLATICEKY